MSERQRQNGRGFGHDRHYPVISIAFRVLLLILCSGASLCAQESGLDTLPSSFASDSLATATWDDSTRTAVSDASSARWTMASRDGVVRRAFSVRTRDIEGVSAEVQHSDPGGLRRRSLQWKSESFALRAGDLSPWSDHPLLEGASRRNGSRDTALEHQFVYGSGTRPNGLDLDASWLGLRTRSRSRWERESDGRLRGSGVAMIEIDGFCLGARASDSSASLGSSRAFLTGYRGGFGHLEAAWTAGGSAFPAVDAAVKTKIDDLRIGARFRSIPARFRHDGLATGWAGTSAAQLRCEKRIAPHASLGTQIDAVRDSTGKVSARGASSLQMRPHTAMDIAVRAGLSENQTSASRWFASTRVVADLGELSPFAEMSVRDSLGVQSPSGRAGVKANRGNQELLASAAMSPLHGATWTASHKTRLDAGATRLEFALSASGAARSGTPVTAQGSIACAW